MGKRVYFVLVAFAITTLFFTSFIESYAAAPNAPTGLVADDVSPTQIDLSWNAPTNDGGSAITGYKIEVNIDNAGYIDLEEDTGNTDTTYSHTGLTTDTTYRYRVYAINADDISDSSGSAIATPTDDSEPPVEDQPPDAPTAFKASAISTTKIVLTWNEPIPCSNSALVP